MKATPATISIDRLPRTIAIATIICLRRFSILILLAVSATNILRIEYIYSSVGKQVRRKVLLDYRRVFV